MQSTYSWVLVLPGLLQPYIMLLKEKNLWWNLESEYIITINELHMEEPFFRRQNVPYLLQKLKDHYCVHNSQPPIPILIQMNPLLTLILPYMSRYSKRSFPLRFSNLLSLMCASFPGHLILIHLINLIIFDEAYRL